MSSTSNLLGLIMKNDLGTAAIEVTPLPGSTRGTTYYLASVTTFRAPTTVSIRLNEELKNTVTLIEIE
jgi:hypothetical protein